jgi:hypothetical protein
MAVFGCPAHLLTKYNVDTALSALAVHPTDLANRDLDTSVPLQSLKLQGNSSIKNLALISIILQTAIINFNTDRFAVDFIVLGRMRSL